MNYKMEVLITDPNTPKGMTSNIFHELDCSFSYDPDTYGNGHYVFISSGKEIRNSYDIRYDKTFNRNHKAKWLANWAYNYWSGEDGAWKIQSLKITEIDETV